CADCEGKIQSRPARSDDARSERGRGSQSHQELPDKRDISVVMISADTNADKVSQCIELGADDYLPKPFNPTILRARIGAALRRQSLRALESEYLGKIENEKRLRESLAQHFAGRDRDALAQRGKQHRGPLR